MLNLIHRPCVFHWTTIEGRGGERRREEGMGGEGYTMAVYQNIY
jgi:hypothetical protein